MRAAVLGAHRAPAPKAWVRPHSNARVRRASAPTRVPFACLYLHIPPMKPQSRRSRKLPRAASRAREHQLAEDGYELVAGVDEAGCGALAGPVVAAAVILRPSLRIAHLTDSKQLLATDREALCQAVQEQATAWAMALSSPQLIDSINIRRARLRAMKLAVEALSPAADFALIDGNAAPQLQIPCQAIISGDSRCRIIAAASILAKVMRDAMMVELDAVYPEYGFAGHKGYGTPQHLAAIARHGPCSAHRTTFAPILASLQQTLDLADE